MKLARGPRGPRRRPARAGVPVLVTGLALAAVLTACGSDGSDPSADPTPTSSSSGAGSSAPTSESPSVDPATGLELTHGALTVHVPEGWTRGNSVGTLQVSADAPQRRGYLAIGKIPAVDPDESVMSQGKFAATHGGGWKKGSVTIEPIVSLGGEPAYHISGIEEGLGPADQVGLVHDGVAYTLNFDRDFGDGTQEEWAQIIASVLASASWSG
ncbi:hypothetical protein [Nocardioides mangrovi]|uniref:DUF1795 domain-containing protein n=1 Tax=Nocardioides mangrovi TaxID=2874580 RepID=A0ABS7UCU3_9ACTN|nr:hypothetical protein [Nocardioides mangrovi]MBZ5738462.1 hypothetical protein [Nocardioides mangrovi]